MYYIYICIIYIYIYIYVYIYIHSLLGILDEANQRNSSIETENKEKTKTNV